MSSTHGRERSQAFRTIRVAIVNRGEAAVRALHSLNEASGVDGVAYRTIALYTEPDHNAIFVRRADEAVSLGPATYYDASEQRTKHTYLDKARLLAVLSDVRADAVWVGWGFVAEDADFAARCESRGIVFIGPSAHVMRSLGDKIQAKSIAQNAGVPVLPWSNGPVATLDEARAHAERIGYPLFIKATAGGGGRGIREVLQSTALERMYAEARREGELAFGDATVFLERRAARARHVEVQVLCDHHGAIWILGIRECSVQRRRQKVLEESGLAVPNPSVEKRLRQYAQALCKAVGYTNAGTIEFIYEPDTDAVYFMEVNTRLQVEHTVTELVTGVDLVRHQLHVAFGGRLVGKPPPAVGHAVEVRLNAEDPEREFAPAPGRVTLYRAPNGPGVRVDSGVGQGDQIPAEFDSMIAKIIAWAPERSAALRRLHRALAQTEIVIDGGATNKSFLLELVQHPQIMAGEFHTAWLGEILEQRGQWLQQHAEIALAQGAVAAYEEDLRAECERFLATAARGRPEVDDRNGRDVELRCRGNTYSIHVLKFAQGSYRLTLLDGSMVDVRVERLGDYERTLELNGRRYQTLTLPRGPEYLVEVDGVAHRVFRNDGGSVRSHCPALVVAVLAGEGEEIAAGAPLFVLESMKMESTVCAPWAGRVRQVLVMRGAQVDAGDVLARIDVRNGGGEATATAKITFSAQTTRPRGLFDRIHSLILGYDVEPEQLERMGAALSAHYAAEEPTSAQVLAAEQSVMNAFCDIHALAPHASPAHASEGDRAEDFLLAYLRLPERANDNLPAAFLADLQIALRRYGIEQLEPHPALEEALLRVSISRRLARRQEAIIIAMLLRWRKNAKQLLPQFTDGVRDLLDRLTRVTNWGAPAVSDLARSVRLRYFDQVMLERGRETALRALEQALDRQQMLLQPDAVELDALVASGEPLQDWLLPWVMRARRPSWELALRLFLRIQYRHHEIESISRIDARGGVILRAATRATGTSQDIVAFVGEEEALADLVAAASNTVRAAAVARDVIVEIICLSHASEAIDSSPLHTRLFERHLSTAQRIGVTTIRNGGKPSVGFHTYERQAGQCAEVVWYRNFHATTAERLELWRLQNFAVTQLRTAGHFHLFACSAQDNPKDHRLFAYAELRDLGPIENQEAQPLLRLELTLLKCLDWLRQQLSAAADQNRYVWNRVVLYVEPLWDRPLAELKEIADRIAPYTRGLSLDHINVRVRLASTADPRGGSDTVINLSIPSEEGVQMGSKAPTRTPIRTLSDYRAKSVEMRRLGFTYPYDIIRLLSTPGVTHSDYPPGEFREYDLDEASCLVPVERPHGLNTANLVVGVVTNFTPKFPEGMSRVVILNDPSKSLASLGEAECRRILAALELARARSIPVEWFAVSSGARVAMESGTENMDWTARVLRGIVRLAQDGHEINIIVTGVNVGAQSYWNAEATMLMHSRGILIMVGDSAMVLTGKQALDYSGAVSADNNAGIGGYDKIMGPNGEAQYWAPDVGAACTLLFRHYDLTYVAPGERFPRRSRSADEPGRDIRESPHAATKDSEFACIGDIFERQKNPERKRPFDIRSVMRAVADTDDAPLERWRHARDADTAVVWDVHLAGMPVCLIGIESRELQRSGIAPADGPQRWSAGTLFPRSSKKVAKAINAASGNRPVVVLANLSGFDGSPESMRELQLEYGAEIGRAVVNFKGPFIFCVLSRYHGGAFVVFSKALNDGMETIAVEGAYASVLGGAPAAAVVFSRQVEQRVRAEPRVVELNRAIASGTETQVAALSNELADVVDQVRAEQRAEIARQFDGIHTIDRALRVGSIDRIVSAASLRAYIASAIERGMRDGP